MRKLAKVAMVVSLFAATVGLAVPMAPPPAVDASSHREAPLTAFDPQVDATDLYAFVSPDRPDTVTLIANYVPLQIPYGGPNFYRFGDDVLYEINIDNNGDALPDVKYQFRFRTTVMNPDTFLYNTGPITSLGDATWNVRQSYSVTRVDNLNRGGQGTETVLHNNLISPPVNVGFRSTPNYDNLANAAIHTIPSGTGDPAPIRVFAGQREDPFFVDLAAIFDLLHIRKLPGNAGGGRDALAGVNVNSIALQIPINQLTRDGRVPANKDATNAVVGVWTTSSRRSMPILRGGDDLEGAIQGGWRQVSRLGHPLVNEVVVPLAFKDHFNGSEPKDDAQFLAKVVNPELPKLLNAIYQINVPPTPRLDLVAVFLTGVPGLTQPAGGVPSEMLRLNLGIGPGSNDVNAGNPLGVIGGDLAGFPNGRRLKDDVVDVALRVMAGALVTGHNTGVNVQLGDGVDANDKPFMNGFPYVASPNPGNTQ